VRGSWVIALYYDPSQEAFDQDKSKGVQIGQDGRQAPFNVSGLVAGQYVLVGFKDMDGDRQVSSGDYLGIYADSQGNVLIAPGRSGLSLVMEVYGGYGYQNAPVGLPAGALGALRVLSARTLASQHGMPKPGLWGGFLGAPTAAFAAVGYLAGR